MSVQCILIEKFPKEGDKRHIIVKLLKEILASIQGIVLKTIDLYVILRRNFPENPESLLVNLTSFFLFFEVFPVLLEIS